MREHGLVRRRVEPQAPAVEAAFLRERTCALEHELGQSRERPAIRLAVLERVGGIHDVLLELRLMACELLHDRAEPLARLALQRDTAEAEVAQRVRDELAFDGAPGPYARLQRAEVVIERLVLPELGIEL